MVAASASRSRPCVMKTTRVSASDDGQGIELLRLVHDVLNRLDDDRPAFDVYQPLHAQEPRPFEPAQAVQPEAETLLADRPVAPQCERAYGVAKSARVLAAIVVVVTTADPGAAVRAPRWLDPDQCRDIGRPGPAI